MLHHSSPYQKLYPGINSIFAVFIITGVTTTTLIVQLAGPPLVELAGETGRNVTEDDVIDSLTAMEVMDRGVIPIKENQTLSDAIEVISEHDYLVYPVVNQQGNIIGTLSLDGLKAILPDQDSWAWLLASDVVQPLEDMALPSDSLKDVLQQMRELKIEHMPVVEKGQGSKPVGMLNYTRIRKHLGEEILRRQKPIEVT